MSCGSGGMAALNLWVKRNATFRRTFTFNDDEGGIYDLTGWSFELQVRATLGGASAVFTVTTTANANGSIITVTDAEAGEIEVYIDNADILLVPEATDPADAVSYVYDLVVTDTEGDFAPFVGGSFTVIPGVSE